MVVRLATVLLFLSTCAFAQPIYLRYLCEQILHSTEGEERSKLAELLTHGHLDEAVSKMHSIAAATPDSIKSARLRALAADLKREDPTKFRFALENDSVTVPLGQLSELSSTERALFRSVEAGSKRVLSITIKPRRVQQFQRNYGRGFTNPEPAFARADPRMQAKIQRARSASRNRVVTVISSGKDRDLLLRYVNSLESDGFEVLSYLLCETSAGRFCSDELIGAFASISGHVVELKTPNSLGSSLVFEEEDAYRRLMAGQALVTIVATEDLANLMVASSTKQYLLESTGN